MGNRERVSEYQREINGRIVTVKAYERTNNDISQAAQAVPGRPRVAATSGNYANNRATPGVWPQDVAEPARKTADEVLKMDPPATSLVEAKDRIEKTLDDYDQNTPAMKKLRKALADLNMAEFTLAAPETDNLMLSLRRGDVHVRAYTRVVNGKVIHVRAYSQMRDLISQLGGPNMAARKGITQNLMVEAMAEEHRVKNHAQGANVLAKAKNLAKETTETKKAKDLVAKVKNAKVAEAVPVKGPEVSHSVDVANLNSGDKVLASVNGRRMIVQMVSEESSRTKFIATRGNRSANLEFTLDTENGKLLDHTMRGKDLNVRLIKGPVNTLDLPKTKGKFSAKKGRGNDYLVTLEGKPAMPPIQVKPNTKALIMGSDGSILSFADQPTAAVAQVKRLKSKDAGAWILPLDGKDHEGSYAPDVYGILPDKDSTPSKPSTPDTKVDAPDKAPDAPDAPSKASESVSEEDTPMTNVFVHPTGAEFPLEKGDVLKRHANLPKSMAVYGPDGKMKYRIMPTGRRGKPPVNVDDSVWVNYTDSGVEVRPMKVTPPKLDGSDSNVVGPPRRLFKHPSGTEFPLEEGDVVMKHTIVPDSFRVEDKNGNFKYRITPKGKAYETDTKAGNTLYETIKVDEKTPEKPKKAPTADVPATTEVKTPEAPKKAPEKPQPTTPKAPEAPKTVEHPNDLQNGQPEPSKSLVWNAGHSAALQGKVDTNGSQKFKDADPENAGRIDEEYLAGVAEGERKARVWKVASSYMLDSEKSQVWNAAAIAGMTTGVAGDPSVFFKPKHRVAEKRQIAADYNEGFEEGKRQKKYFEDYKNGRLSAADRENFILTKAATLPKSSDYTIEADWWDSLTDEQKATIMAAPTKYTNRVIDHNGRFWTFDKSGDGSTMVSLGGQTSTFAKIAEAMNDRVDTVDFTEFASSNKFDYDEISRKLEGLVNGTKVTFPNGKEFLVRDKRFVHNGVTIEQHMGLVAYANFTKPPTIADLRAKDQHDDRNRVVETLDKEVLSRFPEVMRNMMYGQTFIRDPEANKYAESARVAAYVMKGDARGKLPVMHFPEQAFDSKESAFIPYYLKNAQGLQQQVGKFVGVREGTTVEQATFVHESGHFLDFTATALLDPEELDNMYNDIRDALVSLIPKDRRDEVSRFELSQELKMKHSSVPSRTAVMELEKTLQYLNSIDETLVPKHISAYGATNARELIAESWASYVLGGEKTTPMAKHIGSVLEEAAGVGIRRLDYKMGNNPDYKEERYESVTGRILDTTAANTIPPMVDKLRAGGKIDKVTLEKFSRLIGAPKSIQQKNSVLIYGDKDTPEIRFSGDGTNFRVDDLEFTSMDTVATIQNLASALREYGAHKLTAAPNDVAELALLGINGFKFKPEYADEAKNYIRKVLSEGSLPDDIATKWKTELDKEAPNFISLVWGSDLESPEVKNFPVTELEYALNDHSSTENIALPRSVEAITLSDDLEIPSDFGMPLRTNVTPKQVKDTYISARKFGVMRRTDNESSSSPHDFAMQVVRGSYGVHPSIDDIRARNELPMKYVMDNPEGLPTFNKWAESHPDHANVLKFAQHSTGAVNQMLHDGNESVASRAMDAAFADAPTLVKPVTLYVPTTRSEGLPKNTVIRDQGFVRGTTQAPLNNDSVYMEVMVPAGHKALWDGSGYILDRNQQFTVTNMDEGINFMSVRPRTTNLIPENKFVTPLSGGVGVLPERDRLVEENKLSVTKVPSTPLEGHAQKVIRNALEIEPRTTSIIENATKVGGGQMLNLHRRMESVKATSQKVRRMGIQLQAANPELSNDEAQRLAAENIKDSLKYTAQFKGANFVNGMNTVVDSLRKNHFTVRNSTWDGTGEAPANGVRTNIVGPNGTEFEIQFHTPESFELNKAKHEWGKVATDPNRTPAERAHAINVMETIDTLMTLLATPEKAIVDIIRMMMGMSPRQISQMFYGRGMPPAIYAELVKKYGGNPPRELLM